MLNLDDLSDRRILVTGGRGFIGRHVIARLSGTTRPFQLVRHEPLDHDEDPCVDFVAADLCDPISLRETIARVRPDSVIHLAGISSASDTSTYYQVNTLGTVHLLEALRLLDAPVRVVIAGSAAELGPVEDADLPVGEDYFPRPTDSYGLSKLLATTAALSTRTPLQVMVTRIFNPIGPGLPETQALGRFAAVLARAREPEFELSVGDLTARRDFIDVRDVADAIISVLFEGTANRLYHVGTGASHSVADGLASLIALSGRRVTTRFDPALSRRPGPRDSRADTRRLRSETTWSPRFTWERSLTDLWDDARLRLTALAPVV